MREEWSGFKPGNWSEDTTVNVRDFIQLNYTPYEGDDSFLAKPTEATKKLSAEMEALFKKAIKYYKNLSIYRKQCA